MIDHATAERIKAAANIVEVVGDYVKLTRRGANYMGLCPFHNERTPSFSVNKAKNFCYCFSCHKGGSPVNFIMEKEGIGYQDALRQLARKYGIKIEEKELTNEERRLQSEREAMYMAGEWAMQAMEHNLTATTEGRTIGLQYFYQRGLTDEAIRKFHLGYCPDRNVLEQAAKREGFDPEILKKIGLLGTSQQGRVYDRFHGRVMYPVLNPAGKVVAFGGRDLKGDKAKYINSPETEIYKKGNELYGLYQARQAIVKADKCYLVEGYMDVIGMWQAGMENVIASSGTALTDAQIALIHRFTNNITLLYDGDVAGVKASLRGIDMLLAHNLDIKVLLLPDGHDPDSYARANTPEQFRAYVEAHEEDFITFKAGVLTKQNASDPQTRARVAASIVESLACIADKVKRNIYIKECSRILDIDEQALSYETDIHRHKIVEQLKDARRKKQEHQDIDHLPQQPSSSAASEPTDPQISLNHSQRSYNETVRIERLLLKYCIRYGMIPFSDDEEHPLTVVEYIKSEMEADAIQWVDPSVAAIFSHLLSLIPEHQERLKEVMSKCATDKEAMFKEKTQKLVNQEIDLPGLEKAEKKLREELDEEEAQTIYEFSRDFISQNLINSENDTLRTTATQMVTEPYTLSRYHEKTGHIETEEDKIYDLVPRTLNELRAQIVETQIKIIEDKLRETTNIDEQMKLMQEMQPLLEQRKRFAICNGERIISPRR